MENFIEEECCKCGVIFAISKNLQENWKRDKKTFYCPNGHPQSYTKGTAEILQEKLNKKQDEIYTQQNDIYELNKEVRKLEKKVKSPKKKK